MANSIGEYHFLVQKGNFVKYLLFAFVSISWMLNVHAQDSLSVGNFNPSKIPMTVKAIPIKNKIIIDGNLKEADWALSQETELDFLMEPRQGGISHYKTTVKVLYDDKNLYFGVFCEDSLGKKGIRIQDLRRDFLFGENDMFFVQLDPQNTKQFCVSFQTTPYGNQRDVQVFDDSFIDTDWDALWKVRTSITENGYFAEFAIPFASLRYNKPNSDSTSWGITFSRLARRNYEQSVFPPIPQSFSPYRMTYAAQLIGLKLPAPSTNIQILPYTLFQANKSINNGNLTEKNNAIRIGGEVKWAIKPQSVMDFTFNTDFAQVDVDRAINNTTRFNVFFPERRQFFLENRGVYAGSNTDGINPFFSRTIGLSNAQFNAVAIPIDAGLRYTDRTQKRTIAGLYVHQRGNESQPAANIGVFRYLHNYGKQNNIGMMVTHRLDERNQELGVKVKNNTTWTVDGLIRPNDSWTMTYLLSASRNNTNDSIGLAGHFFAGWSPQNWYWGWATKLTDRKYVPGVGLVFANNTMHHNPGGYYIWRPKGKLGKWIRRWDPGFFINHYQNTNDLSTQETSLYIFPVYIITSSNASIEYSIFPTFQRYNFSFPILGREVPIGHYNVTRHLIRFESDASRKISIETKYEFGGYFNGNLNTITLSGRIAPTPHLSFNGSFERNSFSNFGIQMEDFTTDLYTAGLRFAINPRIQFSAFYQYNTFNQQGIVNARASWEFSPLSFLHLVFNENNLIQSKTENQNFISKISYLKQF